MKCRRTPIMILSISMLLGGYSSFAQTAEEVAQKTEAQLRSYQTLQAEFEHIYYSSSVATPLRETGTCYFQKPGLMKWHYEKPEEKIYLLKESIIESYFPEDNQLLRSSFAKEDESDILLLLSGKQGLLENYTAEFSPFPTENTDVLQIKLTPKKEDMETFILLEIGTKAWVIRTAVFFDWAGNKSEFHFNWIRLDTTLPKKTFELKVPKGTEIISDIK